MSPMVFCDVDGTVRIGKNDAVSGETIEAASRFIRNGGEFYLITAAPASHLPHGWQEWASGAYAESGGVLLSPTGEILVCDEQAQSLIQGLRARLSIEVDDGLAVIPEIGTVVVEGGRKTSLTLLTGTPPHYPGLAGDAALENLAPIVEEAGLRSILGKDTVYRWCDCVRGGKEHTVQQFLGHGMVCYLGDGPNDLEAMGLCGVVPVGFRNGIPQIRALAKKKGVYIDLPGPEGGVAQFFDRLNSGKL